MGDGAIRCDDGPRAVGGGLQASGRGPRTAGGGRQAAGYGLRAADGGRQAAGCRLRSAVAVSPSGLAMRLVSRRQPVRPRFDGLGILPFVLARCPADRIPAALRSQSRPTPSCRKSVAASPYDGSAFEMFHVKHFMIGKII